jgi:uncharacterized protein YecT (DUF1311 family)
MNSCALQSSFRAVVCALAIPMSCSVVAQLPAPDPGAAPAASTAPVVTPAPPVAQEAQAAVQPDALPPPPPPAEFLNRIPAAQMAFLNDYANQTTKEIRKDKRFKELLKAITPRTTYHYGRDMALSDALEAMLEGDPLPVDVQDGRYVMVTTRGSGFKDGHGFVWFDMQEGIGLGGVYFYPTNGEPTPTLAVFSRQLKTDALAWSQLPAAFQRDVAGWSRVSRVPVVTVTYFIPDNGKKYALIHDEDYCSAGAQPDDLCQQRDADAADADMNAAYFMDETGHAANATAWMLNGDQMAWIGMRQSTCGAALGCRITLTRRRTRVLLRR